MVYLFIQVGAALRPAFTPETSSLVTAAACQVCSTWIGSNVARDLNDLRRVHQLLVSSLGKLQIKTNTTQLYNESLATLEKLAILKAWAEVYVVAMVGNGSAPGNVSKITNNTNMNTDDEFGDFEYRGESLLNLVQPELVSLSKHWLAALRDHALLSLPPGKHLFYLYTSVTENFYYSVQLTGTNSEYVCALLCYLHCL